MEIKPLLKRLSGDSFVYSIATISNRMIGFILFPIVARHFPLEEYGAIGLLNTFGLFVGTLSGLGMDSATARWFYDSKEDKYRKNAFQSWMIVQVSILVAAYLIILLASAIFPLQNLLKASDPLLLVSIVLFNLLAAIPQQMVHLYSILNHNRYTAMWLSIASTGISALATVLFIFVLDFGIVGFFLGQTVAFVLCALWSVLFRIKRVISFEFPGVAYIKSMMKYGISIIPANISSFLLLFLTSVIITKYISQSELGYYQAGYTLASGLLLFTMPFNQAFQPLSFSIMDKPESGKFFSWVFDLYVMSMSSICLALGLFFPDIVRILLTEKYMESDFVAAAFSFSNFMYSLSIFALIGLAKMKKIQYFGIIVATSNILLLALIYIGTLNYGIEGASLSFFIGNTITISFLFIISRRIFPIPFRFTQNAITIFAAFVLFIVGYQVNESNVSYGFQLRLMLMVFFLLMVVFYLIKNKFFVNIKQYLKFT